MFWTKAGHQRVLLEAGCGVGNLCYPLLEEIPNVFIHACDFSQRAVQFVKVSLNSRLIISNSENCKTSYSHCSLRASSPEYIQIPEMQLQALLPFPALLPECPQRACWQATVTVETSTCKETTKNNCFSKNNSGMLLCHKGEANQTWDTVPLKSMLAVFHVSILKSWDWIFNSWV